MAERDEHGRFVAGNQAAAGRRKANEYLQRMSDIVTPEKWDKLVSRALADAIKGNGDARRWLSEYIIGKPPTILELRASEAALLRELLDSFEQQGIPASDVFHAMLAQIAEESEVEDGR